MSIIHFEVSFRIFLDKVWGVFQHFFSCFVPSFQHHLLKKVFFLHWMLLCLYFKINWLLDFLDCYLDSQFHSIELCVWLSVNIILPCSYCRFIVSWNWVVKSSNFVLLFQDCLDYFISFVFLYVFSIQLFLIATWKSLSGFWLCLYWL